VSINTMIRTTPESFVGYAEVQHQRHRVRRIREVASHLDVLTLLTPTPSHLPRFYFMNCGKEVSNLVNRPIVSLLGTRVGSTRAKGITKRVYLKLPVTQKDVKMVFFDFPVFSTRVSPGN